MCRCQQIKSIPERDTFPASRSGFTGVVPIVVRTEKFSAARLPWRWRRVVPWGQQCHRSVQFNGAVGWLDIYSTVKECASEFPPVNGRGGHGDAVPGHEREGCCGTPPGRGGTAPA